MAKLTLTVELTDTEQAIPSNQADFVTLVTSRSDYKTRKEIQDAADAAFAEQAKKSGT